MSGDATPSPELRAAFAPLLVAPEATAIVTDYDGTLAFIVDDPSAARPLEGAADLLAALAARFGVVAVVSGRPASYLLDHLVDRSPRTAGEGPHLVGLYGLERVTPGGRICLEAAAVAWLGVVEEAAARLANGSPAGVLVESKGATVVVHWRRVPEAAAWAGRVIAEETARTGLRAFPGRMSVELRPPLEVDKGSAVRELVAGCGAACYFGDDLGDLPAFGALSDLARTDGVATVAVAVVDDETPGEVADAADLSVAGPPAAMRLLRWLAESAPVSGTQD